MSGGMVHAALASPEAFAVLVGQTLSTDNKLRCGAEELYRELQKARPDACVTNLLQLLRASHAAEVRSTCAIFLRKYTNPPRGLPGWEQLSRGTQSVVKRELLLAVSTEQDRHVAKQVADVVVELGLLVLPKPGWPDLLSALTDKWLGAAATAAPGASPHLRETTMQIIGGLAPRLHKQLAQVAPAVCACVANPGLADPRAALAAQAAAIEAVAELLEVLESRKDCDRLKAALPASLVALQGALAAGQSAAAEQMLMSIIKTAERDPKLWRPTMRTAVAGMLSLAGPTAGMSQEVRKLAAEFVQTLCDIEPEATQAQCGRELAGQLLAALAHFLLELEDDGPEWHDPSLPNELDDAMGDLPKHGLECLLRAAASLDSAAVLGAAVEMTRAWAADADWRKRHAVLLALSQVVGECEEVVDEPEMAALAELCCNALRDDHPRVRWAACQALGVLCSDLAPRMQLQQAARVLPALATAAAGQPAQGNSARVQIHACGALVGFLDGFEDIEEAEEGDNGAADAAKAAQQAALAPFVAPLAAALLGLLQPASPPLLLEGCLDVVTRVAERTGPHFAPCYRDAMPRVLELLNALIATPAAHFTAAAGGDEDEAVQIRSRLLASCVDCSAFMARAAGKAAFAEHAAAFAHALTQLCAIAAAAAAVAAEAGDDAPTSEDPLLVPLLSVAQPLAECLGSDMAVLLPPLLPVLAAWAEKDPDLQVVDDEDEDEGGAAGNSGEGSPGSAAVAGADEEDDDDEDSDDDQDDSDVTRFRYGGRSYRATASKLAAKEAATASLAALAKHVGPGLTPHAHALAGVLLPRLVEYPLRKVHESACTALPDLLMGYLVAASHGGPPGAASPAGAQALLQQLWEGLMAALGGGAAGTAAAAGSPSAGARAELIKCLTRTVAAVEPSMLQQAWVAGAFAAMAHSLQAAAAEKQQAEAEAAAAVAEGRGAGMEDEEEEEEDVGEETEEEEEEEEDGDDDDEEGEEEEEEEESPADAYERLKLQVAECAKAFVGKYGDAVGAMVQQLQAAAGGQMAVHAVHSGRVA